MTVHAPHMFDAVTTSRLLVVVITRLAPAAVLVHRGRESRIVIDDQRRLDFQCIVDLVVVGVAVAAVDGEHSARGRVRSLWRHHPMSCGLFMMKIIFCRGPTTRAAEYSRLGPRQSEVDCLLEYPAA